MKLRPVLTALVAASSFILETFAQHGGSQYIDPDTGIVFSQYSADTTGPGATKGGFQLGVAFPQNLDKNEYLGHIVGSRPNGQGWTSIAHAAGMTQSLLLVVWANGRDIQSSFRYSTNYTQPYLYVGSLSFTQLAHSVNKTHFSLTYRCQGCFSWNYGGVAGSQSLKGETVLFGWAQGTHDPTNPIDPNSPIDFHDNGFGVVAALPKLAANPSYDSWVGVDKKPISVIPKTTTAANSLSGNKTAWPVFSKNTTRPPKPTITFGNSGATEGGTQPMLSQTGASTSAAGTPIGGQAPRPVSSVFGPASVSQAPGAPSVVTITRSQPSAGTPRVPTAAPPAASTTRPSRNSTEDDEWQDVRLVDIHLFNTAPLLPRDVLAGTPVSGSTISIVLLPRQTQMGTTSTTSTSTPAPVPDPHEDLGAFPKMSGVPNKPPVGGGGSVGGDLNWSPAVAGQGISPVGKDPAFFK